MKSLVLALCLAIVALTVTPALSQQPRGQQRRGGGPGAPGSSTLERAGLKIGQALPDIAIRDAKGKKFRMADLEGKHSVLVFGCLT